MYKKRWFQVGAPVWGAGGLCEVEVFVVDWMVLGPKV